MSFDYVRSSISKNGLFMILLRRRCRFQAAAIVQHNPASFLQNPVASQKKIAKFRKLCIRKLGKNIISLAYNRGAVKKGRYVLKDAGHYGCYSIFYFRQTVFAPMHAVVPLILFGDFVQKPIAQVFIIIINPVKKHIPL